MRKILYILAIVFPVLVIGQTQTENYIKSTTYSVETTDGTTKVTGGSISPEEKTIGVQYFDGLGRPKQSINVGAGGNQEDIITHFSYDQYGRQVKNFLPYSDGSYDQDIRMGNIETLTKSFYQGKYPNDFSGITNVNDVNAYSEKRFESSPLNRVLEQGAPGTDWAVNKDSDSDHTIKFEYAANTSNEVIYFDVDFIGGDTEKPSLVNTKTYYNEGQLYKTITKDENWRTYDKKDRTTEEFKNKQGQVLLKRTYNNQQPHDTYYVYDDFGNLSYVIPPLASQKAVFYEVSMINIPASSLVTGGSPTGSISIGVEKTGTNTYQFVGDIDLHNLGNSTFINGEITDIPNLDPSLGSYINLGGIYQYDYINDIEYERYVEYYISNEKLYCRSDGYSYNNNTQEDGDDVSAAGFPDITDIDKTKTIGLPDTLEGITEVETQANIQEILDKLCYQYKYDSKNRLIEKKIPSKGWEHIVYDKLDRPVLTQDQNQRDKTPKEWLFTKYDIFGRVAYTGVRTMDYSRNVLQNLAQSGNYTQWESRQTVAANRGDTFIYYSSTAIPTGVTKVYTVNYYDDYEELPNGLGNTITTYYNLTSSTKTKGLPTVAKVRVLGTNNWTTTVTYYDVKGRPIYVYSENTYLGTVDIIESKLGFSGNVLEVKSTHKKTGESDIVTIDTFEYDHAQRVTKQEQQIGSHTELIAKNHYDELGQLVKKDVGDIETNPLQELDYKYNIRGWLKSINNTGWGELGDDLFAFSLGYNDVGARLYNGNISTMKWVTSNDEIERNYTCTYDDLNRLKNAYYGEWNKYGRFNVHLNYDRNGNILNLTRKGHLVNNPDYNTSGDYGTMDQLSYHYNGNQLHGVTDTSGNNTGFNDGNTSDDIYNNNDDDYTYDANGNMIKDKNKGITNITYNHLNLPKSVSINGNGNVGTISYIYDATGVKLKKEVSTGTNTLYAGNYIYEGTSGNEALKFFNHPEGYVDAEGGNAYVYQYKDHLGNVRLSYKENTNYTATEIWSDGFESASGWDGSGNSWGSAISAYDNTHKRTGNYSGRLDENETTSSATAVHSNHWQNININEPTYYTVSAWVYLEDVPDNFAGIYLFMKTNAETGYSTEIVTTSTRTKGQWLQLKKTVMVPAHIDKINVRIDNRYAGKVWFDDVKIHKGNNARTEIVEENNYYPFGLTHKGYNNVVSANSNSVASKFQYNGKELNEELGLNWHDYGARNYDAALGRWMNLDPLAEKYVENSPYAYVVNNPILFVDPDGKQIDISEIYQKDKDGNNVLDSDGNAIVTGYNITVTGKLINFSDGKVDLNKALKDISSFIENSFQGEFDGKSVSTTINLSVAENMEEVDESDHLFVLAESNKSGTAGVVNDFGGKVAFLDADYFTGWYDTSFGTFGQETAAHELGHLFNLRHTEDGLMDGYGLSGSEVFSWELKNIILDYKEGLINKGRNVNEKGLPNAGEEKGTFNLKNTKGRNKKDKG